MGEEGNLGFQKKVFETLKKYWRKVQKCPHLSTIAGEGGRGVRWCLGRGGGFLTRGGEGRPREAQQTHTPVARGHQAWAHHRCKVLIRCLWLLLWFCGAWSLEWTLWRLMCFKREYASGSSAGKGVKEGINSLLLCFSSSSSSSLPKVQDESLSVQPWCHCEQIWEKFSSHFPACV